MGRACDFTMTFENHSLDRLKERILSLRDVKPRDMCWDLGHFKAPMLVKGSGEKLIYPYLLLCIDTASRVVISDLLTGDTPTPEHFLSLLLASMEAPTDLKQDGPVVPHSIRLDDSAACTLLESKLAQLEIKFVVVKHLPVLREFEEITEREFFSHQKGYTGGQS